MRTPNGRGIQSLSLEDGSLIDQVADLHKSKIFDILVHKDRYTISISRDIKIKAYDW